MSTHAARKGYPSQRRLEQAQETEKKRAEAARFLESPIWSGAVGELVAAYTAALLDCPEKDDKLRYQLQMALKTIKKVEKHVEAAHSDPNFDARKVIRRDFKSKSLNPFRR